MITPEEKVLLYVHLTQTGHPEDSVFLDKIEVTKDFTVREVKETILEMTQMTHAKDMTVERVRLRTKQQNMYFGEIYRNEE